MADISRGCIQFVGFMSNVPKEHQQIPLILMIPSTIKGNEYSSSHLAHFPVFFKNKTYKKDDND